MNFFIKKAVWFSQTLNVWLANGHPDQTLSARAHVNQHKPHWAKIRVVLNALFFFQKDHCYTSHQEDLMMAARLLDCRGRLE